MKVVEILKLTGEIMKILQNSCVKMGDYKFVDLYDQYAEMVKSGQKSSYAVTMLAEKYGISERKVYYLLKHFSKDCKIGAVKQP